MLKLSFRDSFKGFIRSISGIIARMVLGAQRGKAKLKGFWDARPFTRIVSWGKEFRKVKNYILKNVWESWGVIDYTKRKTALIPSEIAEDIFLLK